MSYLNFKAVLALLKTARSAQIHKSTFKFHLNCLEHSICISLSSGSRRRLGGKAFKGARAAQKKEGRKKK